MEMRLIDELDGPPVEHCRLNQIEVELRPSLEQRCVARTAGDRREDHHLEAIDETGRQERAIQGDTAWQRIGTSVVRFRRSIAVTASSFRTVVLRQPGAAGSMVLENTIFGRSVRLW